MDVDEVLQIDPNVEETWPGAGAGILWVNGLSGAGDQKALAEARRELEGRLRRDWAGRSRADIGQSEPFASYGSFYKRFKKTYHVLLQLESVALKGRDIASPDGLVAAMFMAELETGLLTAGHDPNALRLPLSMRAAAGGESFRAMGGEEKQLKPDDLYMADEKGIISSIIYGPDDRTRLARGSDSALFTCYAVPGVSQRDVSRHLALLGSYLGLLHPSLEIASTGPVWP